MTTAEASAKVCPFIQNAAIVMIRLPVTNQLDLEQSIKEHAPANIRCTSENCMAWHWHIDDGAYPEGKIKFSNENGYCRLIHEGEV